MVNPQVRGDCGPTKGLVEQNKPETTAHVPHLVTHCVQ